MHIYIYNFFEEETLVYACILLTFHAICYLNHQVYYLYYSLKITKICVKDST